MSYRKIPPGKVKKKKKYLETDRDCELLTAIWPNGLSYQNFAFKMYAFLPASANLDSTSVLKFIFHVDVHMDYGEINVRLINQGFPRLFKCIPFIEVEKYFFP